MCDKCTPRIEYEINLTLCPKRRQALGKAMGLVKTLAEGNRDPKRQAEWKALWDDLKPVAEQILEKIGDINKKLGL